MPNIGSVLKTEIVRLARKEVRSYMAPMRKSLGVQRRNVQNLKRLLAESNARLTQLAKTQERSVETGNAAKSSAKVRFVAKGLRSLRSRLGVSANDLARLIGVSQQSIYNWETKKAVPRAEQLQALASVRSLGKRELQARLRGLTPVRAAKRDLAKKGK